MKTYSQEVQFWSRFTNFFIITLLRAFMLQCAWEWFTPLTLLDYWQAVGLVLGVAVLVRRVSPQYHSNPPAAHNPWIIVAFYWATHLFVWGLMWAVAALRGTAL